MAWYLDHIIKLAAMGSKSVEEFLTGRGVSEDVVSYITTIVDQRVKQQMVGYLAKNPKTTFEMLQQQFNRQNMNTPVVPPKPQYLDSRFRNPQEKTEFFAQVPREYVQWVTTILNDPRFNFIPSEDYWRLAAALDSFTQLKKRNNIPLEKDINKYRSLNDLENAMEPYKGTGSETGGYLQYNPAKLPGVEVMGSFPSGLILYKISNAESLAKIGLGTKWCTREDYRPCQAANYIADYGFIYTGIKGGKPFIQMTPDLNQLMDVRDRTTSLPRELYGILGEQYAEKINVPYELLKEFSSEETSNNAELILNKIRTEPKVMALASDELCNDPLFMIKAIQINGDSFEYASHELQENDDFERTVNRLKGEFNYDLSYRDVEDDLIGAIYSEVDYGVGNLLGNWDIDDAYKAVLDKVSDDRGGVNHRYSGCGETLGNAAVDSDIDRIKAGRFGIKNIKNLAYSIARSAKKHPKMDYDRLNRSSPEYLNGFLEPYLEKAKLEVSKTERLWDRGGSERTLSEAEYINKVRRRAFSTMQSEPKFLSLKKIEDLPIEAQQEYVAEAIDNVSQIGSAYKKRQENFEKYDYDDSYINYPDEPDLDDYESEEEHQQALEEHEAERDRIREEEEKEYFSNNLPFCLDDAIIEQIEKQIIKTGFKIPQWIPRFFSKSKGGRPNLLWAIEQAKKKAKEQQMVNKPRKRRIASGWYSMAKLAYEEYDRPETYLEVGHSGFIDGKYGCNHIWAQDLNTGFKCVPETPEANTHDKAQLSSNSVLYRGRVDTCRNIASINPSSACSRYGLQLNPRYEKVCARQCVLAMDNLKKQFGSKLDIRFM